MSLLLDTCTLLWLVTNRTELSGVAERAIDGAREVFVSAASAFEIGIKHRLGKLPLTGAAEEWWRRVIERLQLVELSITPTIALISAALPTQLFIQGRRIEHRDPGDRFIAATATSYGFAVVTPDLAIAAYPGVSTLW